MDPGSGNEFEEGNPIIYPAAWPHVLSVAATTIDGKSAYFSNANAAIDVAAPGVDVPVAVPVAFDTDGTPDGVTVADGTSFSAPMVAGAMAWIISARSNLTTAQAADLLRSTTIDLGPVGWDPHSGYGQINLDAALVAPDPPQDTLEPNDYIAEIDGQVFGRPDPSVWNGFKRRTLTASVDRIEDPEDIYRLRIPAKAQFRVRLRPTQSDVDPDLEIHARTDEFRARSRIAVSYRPAGRTESITVSNNSGDPRIAYVRVLIPEEAELADARYRLEFTRLRRRR